MPLTIQPNADFTGAGVTQAQFKTRYEALLNELRTNAAALADIRGYKNDIVNGSFAVNQTGATSAADGAYHLDQWYALTESGNVTIAQQALQESGQRANLRMTQPDVAAKRIGSAQPIEAGTAQMRRGASMVLSGRVRCSLSQAIRFAVLEHTGTADSITRDVVSNWASGTFTPSNFFIAGVNVLATGAITPAANTWTGVTLPATVGATANNLIVFFWTEGTLAQNATLDIGRIQLEAGTVFTAYEVRPLEREISLCQRFWQQTYAMGVAAGTVGGTGSLLLYGLAAATFHQAYFRAVVAMRASPTITVYSTTTGASGMVGRNTTDTAAAVENVSESSWCIGDRVSTPSTDILRLHYTASARL